MNVVDRFLNYVKFDTQSDELTNLTPSTPGQMIFAQALEKELQSMGLENISLDENGYLMATLPGNIDKKSAYCGIHRPSRHVARHVGTPRQPAHREGLRGRRHRARQRQQCGAFACRFPLSFANTRVRTLS